MNSPIQISLRRVRNKGVCSGADCKESYYAFDGSDAANNLFVIVIESERLRGDKLLSLDCVCEECALRFLQDLKEQLNVLGHKIISKDYTVDSESKYDPEISVLDEEIAIQDAVIESMIPEYDLDDLPEEISFDQAVAAKAEYDFGFAEIESEAEHGGGYDEPDDYGYDVEDEYDYEDDVP